jgi:6-phosphofructokinase 1
VADRRRRLGILCGGGPAPGINSVISAATIEAVNSGWEVVGILDGFEHLIEGSTEHVHELGIPGVSRIHVLGGSILFTSRANPTVRDPSAKDPAWRLTNCLRALSELDIDALVTIGGDDTAYSASELARASEGRLRVAHVPKTIDNDLPLPGGIPTFGFQTARHSGVEIVNNLMTDAITTKRWYFVVAMGRSAGHLALGIQKAAGATLAIIAEEFPGDEPIRLEHLTDILETSMLKRIAHGRPFGVAILAEGLALRFPDEDLQAVAADVERDEHGNVRLGELHLHRVMTDLVADRFKARGHKVTIVAKNIGYELRCAPPIPFDIDYTRDLGFGAFDYLRRATEGGGPETGAMVTLREGHFEYLRFGSFADPATGRPRIRGVDLQSATYRVATEYMIKLNADDLADSARLDPIASAAGMSQDAFRGRYGYLAR